MINMSNRRCCDHLAWASAAGEWRGCSPGLDGGVDAGSLCGRCSGWRRPTDGYVINSTWVISPLFITHVRVAPHRLMNHFTDVTNTQASSSLGGEITVRIKWAGAFCGAPQTNETRLFGRSYSKEQFTAGRRYRRDRKLSCFLIFLLNSST